MTNPTVVDLRPSGTQTVRMLASSPTSSQVTVEVLARAAGSVDKPALRVFLRQIVALYIGAAATQPFGIWMSDFDGQGGQTTIGTIYIEMSALGPRTTLSTQAVGA